MGPNGWTSQPAPWTTAGGPDETYPPAVRARNHLLLTDPDLAAHAPEAEDDYERAIRALDLVWECPDDDVVNVTGYCCAGCGKGRAAATLVAQCQSRDVVWTGGRGT